jgi:hypothetical protein
MKLRIKVINFKKENKENKPYTTRAGKSFQMCGILVDGGQYDGKWLSACLFEPDHVAFGWKAGDEVDVLVEPNGQYLNFKIATKLDLLEISVKALEARVIALEQGNTLKQATNTFQSVPTLSPDDIPF